MVPRDLLAVVRLHVSTAWGLGSIPSWGTKILYATWHGNIYIIIKMSLGSWWREAGTDFLPLTTFSVLCCGPVSPGPEKYCVWDITKGSFFSNVLFLLPNCFLSHIPKEKLLLLAISVFVLLTVSKSPSY